MHIIVCLDDRDGMLFNKRRQSQDRWVRQRVAGLSAGGVLRMNGYSARQFEPECIPHAQISHNFLTEAAPGDWCFVENEPLSPFEEQIESLVIFRWNRVYPAETRLDVPLDRWKLTESGEFPGYSHDKITMEVYRR